MSDCPRCDGSVAAGQEYCLECGLRLPTSRVGPVPVDRRKAALPVVVAALIAIAGATSAILLTREAGSSATTLREATGGSFAVSTPPVEGATRLSQWPATTSAWTNILISIPKVEGRDAAVARAEQARRRGLVGVGVLDSSRFASLHPGYWMVFVGIYPSAPEAASRLREAKAAQPGARTERVSP